MASQHFTENRYGILDAQDSVVIDVPLPSGLSSGVINEHLQL